MSDLQIVHLPPAYSEADRAARDYITKKLHLLQREYQDLAAPLVEQLVEIDARYASRVVFIPKPPTGDTP